jgi:xanthine dehydrogenase molybdenum-binding subunit
MAALENHGNVVWWNPDDILTIHTGTQSAFDNRTVWASGLGLPVNKVRVIQHQMGGGFGGKSYTMRHHGLAALLSKKTGKPIKFEGWKEDEFTRCNTRHSFKFNIKTGVKNDGTLTACQVTNYQNAGAYFTDTLGVGFVAMAALDMYPFPNASWTGYPVYTNCPTAGAYRGYGGLQGQYASEQHVDQMAEAIGMDPIAFRKKNHVRSGDPFGFGQVLGSEALDECLDKGAEAIGWTEKWKGFGVPYFSEGSKRRAVGVGAGIHVGVYGLDVVVVKLQEDGSAQVLTGCADAGQGPTTVIPMICAEALKIPYEKVSIILSDTASVPWASATVASRATATSGKAAQLACEDALSQLLEAAAVLLEVDVESLDTSDGEIFVKTNPSLKATYAEVLETVFPAVIVGVGRWGAPSDYAMQGFAANFVDLEVDVDTGEVKLLKVAAAHDVGKAINKNTCENQIEGGICSQGIGMALWEDFVADKPTGKVLNTNYIDFAVPTALDIPAEFETILVEPWEERGPFGSKGCSEIGIVPIGAAVANTIYNAIGVRITEYPIDPRKILTALGKV